VIAPKNRGRARIRQPVTDAGITTVFEGSNPAALERRVIAMTLKNSNTIAAMSTQRVQALEANVSANTPIPIDGTPYKASEVIAIFQASLDTRATLLALRAQTRAALLTHRAAEERRAAIEDGLKAWVSGRFGANSKEAHEFGYAPRKASEKTVETKYHAAELAKKTREARHTMGKRQKRDIKGALEEPASNGGAQAPPPVNGPTPR
jgi:hypothetical protein